MHLAVNCELLTINCYGILTFMERMTKIKKVKRKRKHGFLVLMKSHGGRKVLKRRRATGRIRLAV